MQQSAANRHAVLPDSVRTGLQALRCLTSAISLVLDAQAAYLALTDRLGSHRGHGLGGHGAVSSRVLFQGPVYGPVTPSADSPGQHASSMRGVVAPDLFQPLVTPTIPPIEFVTHSIVFVVILVVALFTLDRVED